MDKGDIFNMSDEKVNSSIDGIAKVEGNIENLITEISDFIASDETIDPDFLIYIVNQLMSQTENLASINTDFARELGFLNKTRLTTRLRAHEEDLKTRHSRIIIENAKRIQYDEEVPMRH